MLVRFPYGTSELTTDLPAGTCVIEPESICASDNELETVRQALHNPVRGPVLRDLVTPGSTVAIAVCDGTRPQPRRPMLTAVLEELDGRARPEDIVVLVATGTHRANTPGELLEMFGPELLRAVRVVNHDARDESSLVDLGTMGNGVPVALNREWVEADVRITTGFVEPHFFAGFSGGPKLVAPGLAGLRTTLTLHDAKRIGDPSATWGVLKGNPVHDDVRAIAASTGVHFACDVVLNRQHRVVGAFAGEPFAMHERATAVARQMSFRPVPRPFDVVVSSNAGFPLDQNLYQCVKGMSAASQVVRPGGLIIVVAECRDGFPEHGEFRSLLASASSPDELLSALAARSAPGETVPDQWQAQVLARVLQTARVGVFTEGLSARQLEGAFLIPVEDVSSAVASEIARVGDGATCCALPAGPETIAAVA